MCYTGVFQGAAEYGQPFFYGQKKGDTLNKQDIALKVLEAASGFEPLNHGFADQCLSRLATPPENA